MLKSQESHMSEHTNEKRDIAACRLINSLVKQIGSVMS